MATNWLFFLIACLFVIVLWESFFRNLRQRSGQHGRIERCCISVIVITCSAYILWTAHFEYRRHTYARNFPEGWVQEQLIDLESRIEDKKYDRPGDTGNMTIPYVILVKSVQFGEETVEIGFSESLHNRGVLARSPRHAQAIVLVRANVGYTFKKKTLFNELRYSARARLYVFDFALQQMTLVKRPFEATYHMCWPRLLSKVEKFLCRRSPEIEQEKGLPD